MHDCCEFCNVDGTDVRISNIPFLKQFIYLELSNGLHA